MTALVATSFAPALASNAAFMAAQGIMNDAAEMDKTIKSIKKQGFGRVNPLLIKVKEGFNSRDFSLEENQQHVAELAESISAIGLQQPLSVFFEDNQIFLEDGESRLRAIFKAIADGADIPFVKVLPGHAGRSEADIILSQIVKNSGKQLNALEQAHVYKRLLSFDWTTKEIAHKVGKSETYINNLLRLLEDPEAVKLVKDGVVSATEAMRVQRELDAEHKEALTTNGTTEGTTDEFDAAAPTTPAPTRRKAGAVLAEVVAAAKEQAQKAGNGDGKVRVTAKDVKKHRGTTTKASDSAKNAIAAKAGVAPNGKPSYAELEKRLEAHEKIAQYIKNSFYDQEEDGTLNISIEDKKAVTLIVKTYKL